MASSSGCAINSSMRLFCNVGNEAPRVLVYIQKTKIRTGTEAQTVQLIFSNGIQGTRWICRNRNCCLQSQARGGSASALEATGVLERALTHVILEILSSKHATCSTLPLDPSAHPPPCLPATGKSDAPKNPMQLGVVLQLASSPPTKSTKTVSR